MGNGEEEPLPVRTRGRGGGLLPPPEDRRPRNTMAMNQGCHPHQGRRLELSRYFTFKKL